MEQHPVPQQISAYEFRLVGDMTLKQFFQLAGGALIALLIYSTELHALIKWPMIIFFSLMGAALAFLPFQGRPLQKWILAFFKSIYSPTVYFWKQQVKPQEFFTQAQTPQEQVAVQKLEVAKTLPPVLSELEAPAITSLEQKEASFFSKLGSLFSAHPQSFQPTQIPQQQASVQIPGIPVPFTPGPKKPRAEVEKPTTLVGPTIVPQATTGNNQAQFSPEAAPPTPPTQPNLVVGQVMDEEGKIIEGAILELRDQSGRPVRALRTNKVGHYLIVTPLALGSYKIITEKEGYEIAPINIEIKGDIIQPIAIKVKKVVNGEQQVTANKKQ